MRLTIQNRIKIAWEALTSRSGHAHPSQEKQLSIFQRGYDAGMKDAELSRMQLRKDADLADMGRPLKFQYKENSRDQ